MSVLRTKTKGRIAALCHLHQRNDEEFLLHTVTLTIRLRAG
jgi:hypothetical protein